MDSPMLADPQKIYIQLLCADIGCYLEDLPRAIADSKRESKESMLLAHLHEDDDDDDINLSILSIQVF